MIKSFWDFIEKKTRWVFDKIPYDNVISSRIRIARNIDKFPFPHNLTYSEAEKVKKILLSRIQRYPSEEIIVIEKEILGTVEKQFLIERRIISRDFVETDLPSCLIIFPREKISIMVNEEDHLRIQSIQPGLNLWKAYKQIKKFDNFLDAEIKYAFIPEIGYITACPTNIGTGLRASVLIHLPALSLLKKVNSVFSLIENTDLMVRGFYGEGTKPEGNIFQITTRETTGKTEIQIIEELEIVVKKIIQQEKNAMVDMDKKPNIKRRIFKKLKELKEQKRISTEEFLTFYSYLWIAKKLNIIEIGNTFLRNLLISILPGYLQLRENKTINPLSRDIKRGKIIKTKLRRILSNV